MNMKLITWNVNGIRAAGRTTFPAWFAQQQADVVCVQEIKARPDQLDETLLHPLGYHSYWHPAQKPGYSGVAIYSKREPLRLQYGMGNPEFDSEGRVLVAEFPGYVLINSYFPNTQRDLGRLPFKLKFCHEMLLYCEALRAQGKNIVLCGDLNVAHQAIDLRNPKANEKCAGFLPEERAWMSELLKRGYVDTFRHFEKGPSHYTWWSYRPGVREKNIGWRIDYFVVNEEFQGALRTVRHQPEVKGSDHCPVVLELAD